MSKGWALRTKGSYLIYSCKQVTEAKAKSNPYMVIFNFIGYLILVLHDFPLPSARWPSSCSDFSGFISLLCHPDLPATFSGLRPSLFSSDHPPCYSIFACLWNQGDADSFKMNLEVFSLSKEYKKRLNFYFWLRYNYIYMIWYITNEIKITAKSKIYWKINFFLFLAFLGFELRGSHLQGRCSNTWATWHPWNINF
jgi:hypothetical protein